MATTLQKRVAKAVAQLEADIASEEVELDARGLVAIEDVESGESAGEVLRDRARAPRLTADARRAVAEIARRKLNKSLAAG